MRQPGQFWGLNMDKNITILGSFLAKNLPGLVNIQKTDGKITIEIVSFPMKHGGSFHSFLYVYHDIDAFPVGIRPNRNPGGTGTSMGN